MARKFPGVARQQIDLGPIPAAQVPVWQRFSVLSELVKIFENPPEYELRSRNNQKLAAKYLDPSTIRDKARQFYNH